MADPARRRATYEDLRALPDNVIGEIIHGTLVTQPRPAGGWSSTSPSLEAYRLEGERWTLLGTWRDQARVRVEPFDAIELELAALWER